MGSLRLGVAAPTSVLTLAQRMREMAGPGGSATAIV
jgi:hypothetical protein